MRADEAQPHPQAYRVTVETEEWEGKYIDVFKDGWVSEQYGWRRYGWFIPVDVTNADLTPAERSRPGDPGDLAAPLPEHEEEPHGDD